MRKMYVDAEKVRKDWGVSKPKAYKMIKESNERMLKDNPNLIVIAGKMNRKFCLRSISRREKGTHQAIGQRRDRILKK